MNGTTIAPLRSAASDSGANSLARRIVHWFTSARSHRVLCVVAGLLLINIFDLILTLSAHRQGLLEESNPIAARILPHGPAALMAYKLTLVAIGGGILIRCRKHRICEVASVTVMLVYVLLAFQWKECYDMYAITVTHSQITTLAELEAQPTPVF